LNLNWHFCPLSLEARRWPSRWRLDGGHPEHKLKSQLNIITIYGDELSNHRDRRAFARNKAPLHHGRRLISVKIANQPSLRPRSSDAAVSRDGYLGFRSPRGLPPDPVRSRSSWVCANARAKMMSAVGDQASLAPWRVCCRCSRRFLALQRHRSCCKSGRYRGKSGTRTGEP
jgi:hypothetical protein